MTDSDNTDEIAEHDLAALRRCMEIADDPGRAEQLESMLRERPWSEVAQFACFCVQSRTLRLKLWEPPPCLAVGDEAAVKLLNKMLAAGVSQYDPDPLAALEAAALKQRRREKAP